MMPIAINGRFLTQGMTGVQRFAREITAAADRLAGNDAWPKANLFMPSSVAQSPFAYFEAQAIGQKSGQIWEQWELPKAAKGSFLINLGNTAPLMLGRNQAVVIHDAGVFDTPESYSFAFRAWYRFLHKMLARTGAQLLTVSEFSRGRIAAALGVVPEAIGVLPEGGDHMLRISADAGLILGRVSDAELRALYENALCLIFPSRYEGFGLPPLEAMTCGCPVIAAYAGAVPEVCGEAALWFDPLRPETLAEAMERLLDEEGLADGMRTAGLRRAALYTWEKAALALLSLVGKKAP